MQRNNQTLNTSTISANNRDENINVVVRIRGKKIDEVGSCSLLNILDNKSIQVENKTYFYDYVANMNSTQEEMFQHCAKRICDNSLKGYNGTIFAYGQTGSGKTYTLLGPNITKYSEYKKNNTFSLDNTNLEMNDLSQDNDLISISENNNSAIQMIRKGDGNQNIYNYDINDQGIGLLPRIIYYLFNNSQKTENVDFKFKISYLEIYQENISDLLNPDRAGYVQLRDIGSSIILDGLRKLIISSPEEALKYIIQGNKLRHTASTLMNNESSRSHAVISIYIEKIISQRINNVNHRKIQKSVFHIIDLAGSERQNKTGVIGERVREAGAINKSLLNLSIVIRDIINNNKQIPYRDSKLTHLLRDSLGGNAKTSIIAAVSPFDSNLSETKSTLNFAQNAKKVKNHARINEEIGNENIREMKILKKYNSVLEENIRLKRELTKYQHDNNNLVSCLKDVEGLDKGIDEFVRDMNNLQEQNAKLTDKIEKSDLELKIKDKKIESLKEQINKYADNLRNIVKEKNKYIAQNVILNGQLKEEENEKNKLEKHYKDQILIMEQNNNNTEQIINNKNIIIDDFTKRINDYINQLSIKDKQINELNICLEKKNNIINEININKINEKQNIENLNKKIKQLQIEIELKQKEIEELTKINNDIKNRGKNLLQKFDEKKNIITDEIVELKNVIKDRDKNLEKAKKLCLNLEQDKLKMQNELEEKSKSISSYLSEIANLHEKYRTLNGKYDSLKADYDKIKNDLENNEINNNEKRNNNFQKSKKNELKRNNTKKISKSPVNNLNNDNLNYKKLYDELKQKYDITLKNISGGKKIKNVQELFNKLNNAEKDLNECRRIMNCSFNKIQDILSKDMLMSGLSNQPFDFNYNSFDSNIEQKFFIIFEKFLEFHMLKENQLKNMKEQNEILNKNIHLNKEKKELFELNNNYDNSINKIIANNVYKSITKSRKGYLFKDLSTNTKKVFDIYNKEFNEKLQIKEEEKHDENSSNNESIIIGKGNQNINNKNIININVYRNEPQNNTNLNFGKEKNETNNNNKILNLYEKENNNH